MWLGQLAKRKGHQKAVERQAEYREQFHAFTNSWPSPLRRRVQFSPQILAYQTSRSFSQSVCQLQAGLVSQRGNPALALVSGPS